MKRRLDGWRWPIAVSAACFGLLSPAPGDGQTSYPLVCRGGPEMTVRTGPIDEPIGTSMDVFFQPAGDAATRVTPPPGKCAWLDRAFGADEPNRMHDFYEGVHIKFDIQGDGQLRGYDFYGYEVRKARVLRSLLDAIFAGEVFTVHVKSAGSGENRHLEIVRVGP